MQYKGIYLLEMTPEKWDSLPLDSTRDMLVWKYEDEPILQKRKVIEWFKNKNGAVIWRDENNELWNFCAEIPTEVSIEDLKEQVERLHADNKNLCNLFNDKSAEYEKLLEENKELKARIKSLCVERGKMANAVSGAVWKELMERATNQESLICVKMPNGLGFNDISDIVLNKILNYKSDNKPEKKVRRMTYKELSEWLATGKGQFKDGNFGSFRTELVYCKNEENTIVDNDCLIRGFTETEWHEPLIEE